MKPDLDDACRHVAEAARAACPPDPGRPCHVVHAEAGGVCLEGILAPDGSMVPESFSLTTDFSTTVRRLKDDRGHRVLWALLAVAESSQELTTGFDEYFPELILNAPADAGIDLGVPKLWLWQVQSYDRRRDPATLPPWWKNKLREAGAWDDATDSLALTGRGEPAHGPATRGSRWDR